MLLSSRLHWRVRGREMSSAAYPSTLMELRWVTRSKKDKTNNNPKELTLKPQTIPVYISTNPSDINPLELRDLFTLCNHSCHRFPMLDSQQAVEPVDVDKLKIALSHSCVLVSVFCRPHEAGGCDGDGFDSDMLSSVNGFKKGVSLLGNLMERVLPSVSPSDGKLVGFGRAVSDVGLTASIYDVMVVPSLQQMGIGRMIVRRIVRMLTSRDIYDIAALCSQKERLFFEACGFGADILNSTTMMYTKTVATHFGDNQTVKRADSCLSGMHFVGGKLIKACPTCFQRNRPLSIFSFIFLSWLGMGKIWVEVCLISARGLRRTSSLWKLQWFAVGWIDPNNKYCTKIDASGNANPVWKTKFAAVVDDSNLQDTVLNVEVYSREPIFLRERLQGTATVVLKEFLAKYSNSSESSRSRAEEVGSYQLRKKNSNKPQGFVDISIRISEERDELSSFPGNEGGIILLGHSNNVKLSSEDGSGLAYPTQLPLASTNRPEKRSQTDFPYSQSVPHPANNSSLSVAGPSNPQAGGPSYPAAGGISYQSAAGPSYRPPRTPPPPPPPSNVGYIPTLIPRTNTFSDTYMNMPSSGPPGRAMRPGVGMGLAAGALAAGAVIFGDDFMSGYDIPAGLSGASLTISTDPPF